MFLEKRVYQGSSGRIYPHTVIEKISDEKVDKQYTALFLENDYLKKNPPKNPESTMEMWQLREQAKMQAEEIVMKEVVLKFH